MGLDRNATVQLYTATKAERVGRYELFLLAVHLCADMWLHINAAMFEQNGRCGYLLKPRVMWDKTHPLYNRFNAFDKDTFGASNPAVLTVVVQTAIVPVICNIVCMTRSSSWNRCL